MLAITFAPFAHADFWIGAAVIAGIYGIFTIGLQLNIGYTGILNFGQAGFMAIGAYAMGILVVNHHWSFWFALPVATLASVLSGLLIGIPSLRLRSDYFAIATMPLRRSCATPHRTRTSRGEPGHPRLRPVLAQLLGLGAAPARPDRPRNQIQLPLLIVVWVVFALLIVFISRLQRTPWGRVLRAIREDEDAARALGKNVFAYSCSRSWWLRRWLDRRLLPRAQRDDHLPERVRADVHVLRLRDPRAGRLRQLLRRRRRRAAAVDDPRGHAAHSSCRSAPTRSRRSAS